MEVSALAAAEAEETWTASIRPANVVTADADCAASVGITDDEVAVRKLQRLYRAGACSAAEADALLEQIFRTSSMDSGAEYEAQQRILDNVVDDPIARRFPPPRDASARVRRQILKLLSSGKLSDVHDELCSKCAEGYCTQGQSKKGNGVANTTFCGHCVLELNDGGRIVLRVTSSIGGGLETGGRIWCAGATLVGLWDSGALDTLLSGHVLELGAGTGILGLGLARRGTPVTCVTLTDGEPATVGNLLYNVEITGQCGDFLAPVVVQTLEWETEELSHLGDVDVVVGSDIMYDEASAVPLARLLVRLLRPRGSARWALLASAERSTSRYQSFLSVFKAEGLDVAPVSFPQAAWDVATPWLVLAEDAVQGKSMCPIHILQISCVGA
eukprot:TRINITY_DN71156_c0_g1_i1.p1 TRINITY_DN71156_c0_g1~~TRINITY_DN71156_c0_g1_i1.p1  ORF type:complete len:400 (-),score=76.32 TRINITY_DN71156_c0_g1_i1:199-1356(-)